MQADDQRVLWNSALLFATVWGVAWLAMTLTGAREGEATRILVGMAAIASTGVLPAVIATGRRGSAFRWWCYGSLLFPLALLHAVALRLRRS